MHNTFCAWLHITLHQRLYARIDLMMYQRPCWCACIYRCVGRYYLEDGDGDVVGAGLVLQPQAVGLRHKRVGRILQVVELLHHVDDGLAGQELEDAVGGNHDVRHLLRDVVDQALRLRSHADPLRS